MYKFITIFLISASLWAQPQGQTQVKLSQITPTKPPSADAVLIWTQNQGLVTAQVDGVTVILDKTNPQQIVLRAVGTQGLTGPQGPAGLQGPPGLPTNFVDDEPLNGVVDGVNGSFTILAAPNPLSSLKVYRNGLRMKLGLDYVLLNNGTTIVFTSPVGVSDILTADYRK